MKTENKDNLADLAEALYLRALADAAQRRLNNIADGAVLIGEFNGPQISPGGTIILDAARTAAYWRIKSRDAWDKVYGIDVRDE